MKLKDLIIRIPIGQVILIKSAEDNRAFYTGRVADIRMDDYQGTVEREVARVEAFTVINGNSDTVIQISIDA